MFDPNTIPFLSVIRELSNIYRMLVFIPFNCTVVTPNVILNEHIIIVNLNFSQLITFPIAIYLTFM